MPLVHVAMRAGKPAQYREAILDGIYIALQDALNVPEDDRFMFITEHEQSNFLYGKTYMDIARSDDLIYVQITVFNTRTTQQKKDLFRRIVELLGENPGIRKEDVFINILESAKENWSHGLGVAQFG